MRVDQWLPAAHRGDAIGDEARRIRRLLREAGIDSDIYALEMDEGLEGDVRPFEDRPEPGTGDVVLLHFALPSPMTEAFRLCRARKILVYHNITPSSFFVGYDDELVRIAHRGREELRRLATEAEVDVALGDSDFNRRELVEMGFHRTGELPILIDFEPFLESPSNPVMEHLLDDGRDNFLFVGRIYPNKKFEDLLRLAFLYKKYVSENFRFLLVGKAGRMRAYQDAVQRLADYWGLRPSEFLFTGHLSWDDLLSCYRSADLFISMSEHEGFAVPLLESMLSEVPVMAFAAGAVPDTLGDAGILFREKKYDELAEMAHLVLNDSKLREAVLDGQRRRLEHFHPNRVEASLMSYVEEVSS